jgi:hypothetical protein
LVREKRAFRSTDDFIRNLHKLGVGLTEFNGTKIPTIYIDSEEYDEVIRNVYGKKIAVDTLLNIFHDERDVFVDVQMTFLDINLKMNFLLYANSLIEFFNYLSESGIIAIAPELTSPINSSNIFMIQLPKKEQAEKAFKIIRTNASENAQNMC